MTPTTKSLPAVDTSASLIHTRALLVWLQISTWTARKYDRKITEKVNAQYAASSDAGRYNKFLLPGDAASYKAMITAAGSIRSAHYGHTLAWSDEGWRLLPTANYADYTTWFREQKRAFTTALDDFVLNYPRMRSQAANLLNGLYKDEDYPSTQDIRSRFSLDVQYSPLPAFGDVRVDLAADQVASIEQSISTRLESAIQLAVGDSWQRLHDVVARIAERLGQPDAIFRDSLIENARDVCATLTKLNVTNDPNLERMRVTVQKQLTAFEPDILRDTPKVRAKVAEQAQAILSQMAGLYQVQS